MAKLRLDVEQWGAILDALEQVPAARRRPCQDDAIVEIRALLRDVATARRENGDPRDAFAHDCAQAACATVAAERAEARGDDRTLASTVLRLLEAEFGSFFVVVTMADGKLAVLALPDDKGVLAKNVVKAAQGWATSEAESKS